MVTVTLERTRREVPYHRKGRALSYRWAPAYHVIGPDGLKLYPPVSRTEAYATARERWPGCKINIV